MLGEGNGNPLQYSCLANPKKPGRLQSMGSWRVRHDWATSLSLFTFMHWRSKWQPIPVFLPGESQGRGSLVGCHLWGRRVGHDWSDLAAAAACPLSWWCHPTISFSVIPFSACPQSSPASRSFPGIQLFASRGQSTGTSASASVLPKNIQGWFPLGITGPL